MKAVYTGSSAERSKCGVPIVTFHFEDEDMGGARSLQIVYEKTYPVEQGYPAEFKGLGEWSVSISVGGDQTALGGHALIEHAAFVQACVELHTRENHVKDLED